MNIIYYLFPQMFVYLQDWDKDLSGGITVEQMREIFRIYKVLNTKYRFTICYIVEAQARGLLTITLTCTPIFWYKI